MVGIDNGLILTYDQNYPTPGIDQPSQQFRDNFNIIKQAIENLQNKQIEITGDLSGTSTILDSGTSNPTLNLVLPDVLSGVTTSASFDLARLTVDPKGRIISISEVSDEYLKTDGTNVMSADLDLGSNNLVNVNLVDGYDVSVLGDYLDQINSSNGIVVRSADGVFEQRQIEGTTRQISINNASGVNDNPQISISTNPTIPGQYLTLPQGSSDPSGQEARIYYDNNNKVLRYYDGTSWKTVQASSGATGAFVDVTGDTMTGSLEMSNSADINLGAGSDLKFSGGSILGDNGVLLGWNDVGSTSYLKISNGTSSTGSNAATLTVDGTGTDGDLRISPKNNGQVIIDGSAWPLTNGDSEQFLQTDGSGSLNWRYVRKFVDTSGQTLVQAQNSGGNADNWLSMTAAGVGSAPNISTVGSETNIDFELDAKGTGNVTISGIKYPNADGSPDQVLATDGAGNLQFSDVVTDDLVDSSGNVIVDGDSSLGTDNYFVMLSSSTGSPVNLTADGSDTNIDVSIDPKNNGTLVLDGLNWPTADGSSGQAIITDGSGNLSFGSFATTSAPYLMISNSNVTGFTGERFLQIPADSGLDFVDNGVSSSYELTVDIVGTTNAATIDAPNDFLLMYDQSASALRSATISNVVGAASSAITSASNLGAGAGEVFKQINSGDIEHRTLVAGSAINISQDANEITISGTSAIPLDEAIMVAANGNDTTGNGTIGEPFATINRALTDVTTQNYTIIVFPGVYSEDIVVSGSNAPHIVGFGGPGYSQTRVVGNHVITTTSSIEFQNLEFVAGNSSALFDFDGCDRVDINNCVIDDNSISTSAVLTQGALTGNINITNTDIIGSVNVIHTTNNSVIINETNSPDMIVDVSSNPAVVEVYNSREIGYVKQSDGALRMFNVARVGVDGSNNAIEVTADNTVGNFTQLENVNLQKSDGSYGILTINNGGGTTTDWSIGDINRDSSIDTLDTTTRSNYRRFARDIEVVYTTSNYTEVDDSIRGHIEGIDNALGSTVAPQTAQYLTLSADGTLTNERVFTEGDGIKTTDNGSGGTYVVEADVNGLTLENAVDASNDFIMYYDASAGALRKASVNTITTSTSSGVTGASNIGIGDGIFKQETSGTLEFRSLFFATGLNSSVGDTITIDIDVPSLSQLAGDPAPTDQLLIYDQSAAAHRRIGISDFLENVNRISDNDADTAIEVENTDSDEIRLFSGFAGNGKQQIGTIYTQNTTNDDEQFVITNNDGEIRFETFAGTTTNVDLVLAPQNTGNVVIDNGSDIVSSPDNSLAVISGQGDTTAGGDLELRAGDSGSNAGGNVIIRGGNGTSNGLTLIRDANGNNVTRFSNVSTAVNYIDIINASTTNGPRIRPVGTDANIDLLLGADGTGNVVISDQAFPNSDGTNGQVLTTDGSGNLFWGAGSTVNSFETIVSDSGSTTADSTTDTLTVSGGTNITTAIAGDTLTINTSAITEVSQDSSPQLGGNLNTNDFDIVGPTDSNISINPAGTGAVVISGLSYPTSDGSNDQVLTTDGAGNLTFTNKTSTSTDQNLWETFTADSGSTTADSITDTFNILGGSKMSTSITGDTLTINTSAISQLSEDASPTLGGDLNVNNNNIQANIDNDIVLVTSGTGNVIISGQAFPNSDGSNGQVLTTDGNGNLSWETSGSTQNLWETVTADTGSTTADTTTDTLTISGGTRITTSISGDILTINTSAISELVQDTTPVLGGTLDTSGFDITSPTDTDINLVPAGTGAVVISGLSYPTSDGTNDQVLTTDGAGNLTFTDKNSSSSTQNLFETISSDSGSTTADTATDTLTISGGTNINTSITGDTVTINSTALANVVEDTTPELGGNLNVNSNQIVSNSGVNVVVNPSGSGKFEISGIEYGKKQTETLNDNASATVFLTYSASYEATIVEYGVSRSTDGHRIGQLMIINDGTNVSISDTGTDINNAGVTFTAAIVSGNVEVSYATTSTGNNATLSYQVRQWTI